MKENGKCRLLMGAYYILIGILLGYAAYYLGDAGFSSWEIGLIYSGSSLVGGILQAAAGRLADSNRNWHWKKQLIVYCLLAILISVLRFCMKGHVWTGASYGLLIMLIMVMMPLVNTSCFYYVDLGKDVDFGIARGVGSASYAAASFILGRLTAASGADVLLICSVAGFILMLASVLIMPYSGPVLTDLKETGKTGRRGFAVNHPTFIVMAAGITLALVFHNIVTTYLINIMVDVGGGSDSMGLALAIAAGAELPVLFLYSHIEGRHGLSAAALIVISCFFFTLRGTLFMAASGVVMIYFIQLLQSVSYGLVTGAKASYAHEAVTAEDDSTAQAVMSMTDSFGAVAGSFLGGMLLSGGGTPLMLKAGTIIAAAGTIVAFISARSAKTGGRTIEQ